MARLGSTRWAGSSVDVLRLFCAFDWSCPGPRPTSYQSWMRVGMKPNAADLVGSNAFFGMGFWIIKDPADPKTTIKYEHGGILPGSTVNRVSKFERKNTWIAVFLNSDVPEYRSSYPHPIDLIEQSVLQEIDRVQVGQIDDFGKYGL